MARILRGEIRWADLKPVQGKEQAGRRPVLDLSHDVLTSGRGLSLPWRLPARLSGRVFPSRSSFDPRGYRSNSG